MIKIAKRILPFIGFLYPITLLALNIAPSNYNFRVLTIYLAITTAIFMFCSLFKKQKAKKIFITLTIIYSIVASTDCFLMYYFGTTFTTNMSYILFQTNGSESLQFVQTYSSWQVILIILSILTLGVVSMINYEKRNISAKTKKIYIAALILFLAGFTIKGNHYYTPAILVKSIYTFRYENKELNKVYSNKKGGEFTNVKLAAENKNDSTLAVIIIGESLTRRHMGLYGYPRNNNPLLSKQNNLIEFRNVISPHSSTSLSLSDVLTYGNNKHPEKVLDGSVIQLCNRAGFKTIWVSNQEVSGEFNSNIITKFSESCNISMFTPGPKRVTSKIYDQTIFPYLDEALKSKEKRKVIFVHLMGSHIVYKDRYPEQFNKFTNDFPRKYYSIKNENKIQIINQYDNSILYNDWIVNSIIEKAKKQSAKSFVLYFSDHGEDVFETNKDFNGHGYEPGTKPMHEIPLILWTSNKYNLPKQIDKNKPYNTGELMFTIADLLHINFDEMDKSKSILFPH